MDDAELVPIQNDDDLGDEIIRLRLLGRTSRQIARTLGLPTPEINRALEAALPVIDNALRRRIIGESVMIIDQVIATHMKTLADPDSASVVIRALCERRFWIGLTGSTDPVQLVQDSKPCENSTSAHERGIAHIRKLERLAKEGQEGDDKKEPPAAA